MIIRQILTHKKSDGTTLLDDLTEAGKGWTDKLSHYMGMLQDKLMPGMKGPNGEEVYSDMYKRSYYHNKEGARTYMEDEVN